MKLSREQGLDLARFVMTTGGVGLLGYGAWLHYPPLGYATAGGAVLFFVIVGMWRARA